MNRTVIGFALCLFGATAIFAQSEMDEEKPVIEKEASADISAIINTFEGLSDRVDYITENNKIRLSTKYGETIYLNLENHIENMIMDYVYGF